MTTVIVTKLAFRVLSLKLFTVANLRHQLGWYYLITLLYSHTNAAPQIYPLYSSLFLSVYWRDNPRGMLWGHEKVCNSKLEAIDFLFFSFFFRMVFPTSEDVYYADKPIWNVVCYFYNKTSIFHGFIGAINGCFWPIRALVVSWLFYKTWW